MNMATKPSIIMIHGFRGTHHGLQLIADNLSDYELIIPDLPGFAAGDTLESYSLESYVTWLHAFIKKQNLKTLPVLLGHSFGSIITAAYAAKYPNTIRKLILVNPIGAPALEGPRALLTKLALFYYWTGRKLPTHLGHKWLSAKPAVAVVTLSMTKTKDKTLRRYIHNQHFQYFSLFHNLRSLSESFTTSVSNNVRDFAKNIPVSTLLIAGEKDDITPLYKQKELVTLFPNAGLKVIKKVGHLTHSETPDQVANLIQDFIKSE
jgi:pimeloyl-ACP methyl ester carboxylesterase